VAPLAAIHATPKSATWTAFCQIGFPGVPVPRAAEPAHRIATGRFRLSSLALDSPASVALRISPLSSATSSLALWTANIPLGQLGANAPGPVERPHNNSRAALLPKQCTTASLATMVDSSTSQSALAFPNAYRTALSAIGLPGPLALIPAATEVRPALSIQIKPPRWEGNRARRRFRPKRMRVRSRCARWTASTTIGKRGASATPLAIMVRRSRSAQPICPPSEGNRARDLIS